MVVATLQEQTRADPGADPEMPQTFRARNPLTGDEVRTIIAQAVTQAVALGVNITVVVTTGRHCPGGVSHGRGSKKTRIEGTRGQGLEGVRVDAELAALSKAGTAAFFATSGNAFTTRTAGDIIQDTAR